MGFLDNYEAARERTDRWLKTYPLGRIETDIVEFNAEKGYVLVKASAWRNETDEKPAGTDYAHGYVGAYQQNMKRWFVEDTVTSAILRVMQLVMGGAERTTREVMERLETMPAKVANDDPWSTPFTSNEGVTAADAVGEIQQRIGGEVIEEAPQCEHGHRIRKEGTKKDGSPYLGYACPEKVKARACKPDVIWYTMKSDGTGWKPQAVEAWHK